MLLHAVLGFLCFIGFCTLWQFIRLGRWPFRLAFLAALATYAAFHV